MRAAGALAAAVLLLVVPTALAASWEQPNEGATLSAIEVVRVRARHDDRPFVVVDGGSEGGGKAQGVALHTVDCGGAPAEATCRWEGFLDTRPFADGAHTLAVTGTSGAPEPLPVRVDNARAVHRLYVWRDPLNPWPDAPTGDPQRRLLWVANLGSQEESVTLSATVTPAWDGLGFTEVVSNQRLPATHTRVLAAGAAVELMLSGNGAATGATTIHVEARAPEASAELTDRFGESHGKTGTPAAPLGLVLLALSAAALNSRRR